MPTSEPDAPPSTRPASARRPLWQVGLVASLIAAAANTVLYVAARLAGVPLELTEVFSDHFGRIPVSSFVLATLLEGGAVATVAAAACQQWAPRPRTWFVSLALAGMVASFWLPVTSDGTTATMVVLSISHVFAALIIVPALALALHPK
ncbi:MAG TPA: DUF6069 family protein [Actinomycetes bacterium]|jgi:hypothetical protein|nr:DUF6069 family protein [Actinomycetes bacterium]